MIHSKILILEKQSFWYPELQRAFQDEPVQIQSCNSLSQVEDFYQKNRDLKEPAIGILDFEFHPAECLLFLGKYVVNSPISTIITGLSKSSDLEWTLRELGVAQILPKPLSSVQLVESCRHIIQNSTQDSL